MARLVARGPGKTGINTLERLKKIKFVLQQIDHVRPVTGTGFQVRGDALRSVFLRCC